MQRKTKRDIFIALIMSHVCKYTSIIIIIILQYCSLETD